MAEVASHFTPIRLEMDAETVLIRNLRHSSDTADLQFTVVVDGPDGEVGREQLAVPIISAGDEAEIVLPSLAPSGQERWLSVEVTLAEDNAWARAGFVIARAQVVFEATPRSSRVSVRRQMLDGWQVGPLSLDPTTGNPISWDGQPVAGGEATLWRAPTSNDDLNTFGSYELADVVSTRGLGIIGPSSAERWREAGLDRMVSRLVECRHDGDRITIRRRQAPAQGSWGIDVTESWAEIDGKAAVSIDIVPFGRFDCTWPRAGWHLLLPAGYTDASWVGSGPGEAYPDSDAGAWLGSFESAIDDLCFDYVIPQESGHRPELRRLTISGAGLPTLRVSSSGPQHPGFTLSRHDAHELDRATHRSELPASRGVHLYLDAAQHGLGSRSCGPDVRPEHQLWAKAVRIDLEFEAPE